MEGSQSHCSKRTAVNVCFTNIVKNLKCDHPCTEGHEIGNIISNDIVKRNKGFLVERFIKPPVTLTFELKCEIDLKYIIIQCSIGAQKTSGIELSIQPCSGEKLYEYVSSGVLKENQKGFVFHRHSEDLRTRFGEEFCFCSFRFSRSLNVVKNIRLKIFRTEGSSIPALGKVEIWGVPHKPLPNLGNSGVNSQNLAQTWQPEGRNQITPNILKFGCEKKTVCSHSEQIQSITTTVPEDFIDPITCDIMCQPVTLPSGKVIDISTLESYEKAESQWGRSPSDPFTGIPFSDCSKPIAACDLKARIDKFLCENSNNTEFLKIPRTVGRNWWSSKVTTKPSFSKLIMNEDKIFPCIANTNHLSANNSHCDNPVKRRKVGKIINQECKIQPNRPSKSEISVPTNSGKTSSPEKSVTRPRSVSFQERVERSLELSLKSTLSSLPSFTTDDKECNKRSPVECNVCKLCDNLFIIPCGHFICRNCLVSLRTEGSFSCSLCKSLFQSCDVKKVHTC